MDEIFSKLSAGALAGLLALGHIGTEKYHTEGLCDLASPAMTALTFGSTATVSVDSIKIAPLNSYDMSYYNFTVAQRAQAEVAALNLSDLNG